MKNNKKKVLTKNDKMVTNNNGASKKHGNIGCIKFNMIFFSFCTIRVIIKALRIETLHQKNLISQNHNKICMIIIKQYVRAKFMGFKV